MKADRRKILHQRLQNQYFLEQKFATPSEVVEWFGAVQAQDYHSSLWGIGLRFAQSSIEKIEQAIETRQILRTWPMRNTIHFVPAKDAMWMLKLLIPRASARAMNVYQKAGLDEKVFFKSAEVVLKGLQGGKCATRKEIYDLLESEKIQTRNSRGMHIIGQLAYRGIICFGPRIGKQPTFVLFDEWVPNSVRLEGDEALAELARRYFTSHGPATIHDFAWWAGLTIQNARKGLQSIEKKFMKEVIDEQTYWYTPSKKTTFSQKPVAHLLPAYDEFTVSYKNRSLYLDPIYKEMTKAGISRTVVIDGQIVGVWNQIVKKERVQIEIKFLKTTDSILLKDVEFAAEKYGDFLQMPVEIQFMSHSKT